MVAPTITGSSIVLLQYKLGSIAIETFITNSSTITTMHLAEFSHPLTTTISVRSSIPMPPYIVIDLA